jgi:hypothetical protein
MRLMNLVICAALLGAGVLLSGCGAGADTNTAAPPANNATVAAPNLPVTATTAAYPAPASGGQPPPATQSAYPPPSTGGQDLVITDENNGQTITLKVGQTLLVELHDRNWSKPVVDTKILAVAPLNISVPQGATAWKYKAIMAGKTNFSSEGACPTSTGGGPKCLSILVYKVMINVTN